MSAATPFPASMDKKPQEPSMEEILASIRRIIADDQSIPGHGTVIQSTPPRAPVPPMDDHPSLPPEPPPFQRELPVAAAFREPEPLGPHAVDAGAPAGADDRPDAVRPHGPIAAPQFPTPVGAAGNAHTAAADARHDWSEIPVTRRPPPTMEPLPEPAESTSATPRISEPAFSEPPPRAVPVEPPRAHAAAVPPAIDPEPDDNAYDYGAAEADEHPYDEPLAALPQDEAQAAPALFSAATDTSISSAFNMLAASRLADNSDELMTMARDMIRPLLRSWLDDNLPSMVERMVRAEIERVARGGR